MLIFLKSIAVKISPNICLLKPHPFF